MRSGAGGEGTFLREGTSAVRLDFDHPATVKDVELFQRNCESIEQTTDFSFVSIRLFLRSRLNEGSGIGPLIQYALHAQGEFFLVHRAEHHHASEEHNRLKTSHLCFAGYPGHGLEW